MWIVNEKYFESHKEAQEYANKFNKAQALIEQIEPSELINPIKPMRITHMSGEYGVPLCGQAQPGKVNMLNNITTVFPHRVNCKKCMEILEQENGY